MGERWGFSELHPESRIRDVTEEYQRVNHMLKNLESISWAQFRDTFELLQTVPYIRCPWGCSEFYSEANDVPFDHFVNHFLDEKVATYTPESEAKCAVGFRQDILEEPSPILGNPEWLCMCCLSFFGKKGPRILTCRYHSCRDQHYYIHPPSNPTGSVSLDADNGLSQVVAVPRTVRKFKANKFSNSYQVNQVMGNYSGLDSLNLSSVFTVTEPRSNVSIGRDLLTMRGRPDYYNFVKTLSKTDQFITKSTVSNLIHQSSRIWDDNSMEQINKMCRKGSTFVALEDAFEVEILMKTDRPRSVRVYSNVPGNTTSYIEKPFLPKWPARLVQVALADSDHGRWFHNVLCEKRRIGPSQSQKLSWMVVNLVHMVPEIWKSLDAMVHSNRNWEGWVLIYLLHHLPLTPLKAKNCPFYFSQVSKKGKLQAIIASAAEEESQDTSLYDWLHNLFQHHAIVNVCTAIPENSISMLEDLQVMIVVFDPDEKNSVRIDDSLFDGKWELRAVFTNKNEVCVRHGKKARSFWKCDIQGTIKKMHDFSLLLLQKYWTTAIYVSTVDIDFDNVRRTLLELQGGQTKIMYREHKFPLVISAMTSYSCIENNCNCKSWYGCPKHLADIIFVGNT